MNQSLTPQWGIKTKLNCLCLNVPFRPFCTRARAFTLYLCALLVKFSACVSLQPTFSHTWHLSCSGACPVPRSWPPVCYHANNTSPSQEPFLTNLPPDGPLCGWTATPDATTQPRCSTVTSLHPLRSTQFWRPMSTASRFVASFLYMIIMLLRLQQSKEAPVSPFFS